MTTRARSGWVVTNGTTPETRLGHGIPDPPATHIECVAKCVDVCVDVSSRVDHTSRAAASAIGYRSGRQTDHELYRGARASVSPTERVKAGRKVDHLRRLKSVPPLASGIAVGKRRRRGGRARRARPERRWSLKSLAGGSRAWRSPKRVERRLAPGIAGGVSYAVLRASGRWPRVIGQAISAGLAACRASRSLPRRR